MKKLLFLPLLALLLLPLGCNKETEYHRARFLRPDNVALYVYADQEWDSVSFETTESYTLSSLAEWCVIPEEHQSLTIPYSNALVCCYAWLHFDANTTGEQRHTFLHLDAGEYSIDANVIQLPFLCVTNPVQFGEVLLPLNVGADTEQATLVFTVFAPWTLTTDCEWLTLATAAGRAGDWNVVVSFQPNTTSEDRTATLTLTSRGVSEAITIVQAKPVEE